MLDERSEEGSSPDTPPLEKQVNGAAQTEPDEKITNALVRVQQAVTDMKDGDLRESLDAAIEEIDSVRGMPAVGEDDQLGPVADALEGALDELEKGKVANLLPVIEQAQSIVQSGSSDT
ncbi:MAG: hypothetical protein ACREFP_05400 [Acetobacteraceae bacterium]